MFRYCIFNSLILCMFIGFQNPIVTSIDNVPTENVEATHDMPIANVDATHDVPTTSTSVSTSDFAQSVTPSANIITVHSDAMTVVEDVAISDSNIVESFDEIAVLSAVLSAETTVVDPAEPVASVPRIVSWADDYEHDEQINVPASSFEGAVHDAGKIDAGKNDALVQLLVSFVREVNLVLDTCKF